MTVLELIQELMMLPPDLMVRNYEDSDIDGAYLASDFYGEFWDKDKEEHVVVN